MGLAFQPDALDARPITLIAYTLTAHIGRHCQAGKPDLRVSSLPRFRLAGLDADGMSPCKPASAKTWQKWGYDDDGLPRIVVISRRRQPLTPWAALS